MDEYPSTHSYADFDDERFTNYQRHKPLSLDELVHRTKFSRKEVQTIYQGFKQECPSGIFNEETFKHIYGQFFPFADTSIYAHLIFSTFDARSPGSVTFEDFLICLSTLCRGSLEERLKWIFTLYDTKRSGKLTRDDFQSIVCAVYSLLGNVSSPPYDQEIIAAHAGLIFERFDHLHQGYVTIQDFLHFCLKDPLIVQSIESLRSSL